MRDMLVKTGDVGIHDKACETIPKVECLSNAGLGNPRHVYIDVHMLHAADSHGDEWHVSYRNIHVSMNQT